MATQTPRRDNLHGEEDVTPRFTGEHSSLGYDDQKPAGNPRTQSPNMSRGDLNRKEENPSDGVEALTVGNEKEAAFQRLWSFHKEKDKSASLGIPGLKNFKISPSKLLKPSKKKITATILAVALGGGGIYMADVYRGPAEAIQLSQVLQKNNYAMEKATLFRLGNHWRFYKTGDVGETRVTKFGSNRFAKATKQLSELGIEFDRNKFTGHPERITVDPSKHPALKEIPRSQRALTLDKMYGVDTGTFKAEGGRITATIDPTTRKGVTLAGSLVNTSLEALGDGKIIQAQNYRVMKKFFNLPKLFSPISKSVAAKENEGGVRLANREERKKADEERRKIMRESVTERSTSARAKIRNSINGKAAYLNGALVGTAGLCMVRSVADSLILVNRFEIVLPSVIEAIDKTALGAQVKAGMGFVMILLGAPIQNFRDENGQSIWQSPALQATSGKKNPSGPDISDDFKQAFSSETTADNLKETTELNVSGLNVAGAACSPAGLAVQGGAGLALLLAGPFTAGSSWAVFAAKAGGGAAATYGALYLLQSGFEKIISNDTLLPATFSGPLGGNLLAYGARESSNMVARSSGGVELSKSETAALDQEEKTRSMQEFASKSPKERLFNIYDHRSLAASLMQKVNISSTQNIDNLASSLMTYGNPVSSLVTYLSPPASAQSTEYDWGFPRYSIPEKLLNDQSLADPYENADAAASIIRLNSNYAERARKCFGVDITNTGSGLGAVPEEDVNPVGDEYLSANCSDFSDPNWKRVVMFVFDDRIATSVGCYEGDDEACSEIGVGGTAPTQETPGDLVTEAGEANIKKLKNPLPGSDCNCEIQPKGITLHWWGGQYGEGIQSLINIFKGNGLSVQLGITSEGEIYQLTEKLTTKTSHAIGGNATTIGIEIEGGPEQFGKEGIKKYPEKFEAVVATVQYLKDKYNIPIRKNPVCDNASGILQHSDFNHCPGAVGKSDIDDYYYNEVIKRVR